MISKEATRDASVPICSGRASRAPAFSHQSCDVEKEEGRFSYISSCSLQCSIQAEQNCGPVFPLVVYSFLSSFLFESLASFRNSLRVWQWGKESKRKTLRYQENIHLDSCFLHSAISKFSTKIYLLQKLFRHLIRE